MVLNPSKSWQRSFYLRGTLSHPDLFFTLFYCLRISFICQSPLAALKFVHSNMNRKYWNFQWGLWSFACLFFKMCKCIVKSVNLIQLYSIWFNFNILHNGLLRHVTCACLVWKKKKKRTGHELSREFTKTKHYANSRNTTLSSHCALSLHSLISASVWSLICKRLIAVVPVHLKHSQQGTFKENSTGQGCARNSVVGEPKEMWESLRGCDIL